MILTETPRRQRVTKLVRWGHWFTFFNILIALTIASLYVFSSPTPSTGVGVAYLFSNWIGHIAFLTFIGFVLLILPLCYLVSNVKVVKAYAALIAAFGLAFLGFDALLYTRHGVHMSFNAAELVKSETVDVMQQLGWLQWGMLVLLFFVWLSFQLLLANALWKRIERFMLHRYAQPISLFFVACFFISHATHIWADANLYQPIVKQDDMFPLSYPATAKTLMSKYGMLDLTHYAQRKALQLDRNVHRVNYPLSPVYCSVKQDVSLYYIAVSAEQANDFSDVLAPVAPFYDSSTSELQRQFSLSYGLPGLYQGNINRPALLLDLPAKLGLPVRHNTADNEQSAIYLLTRNPEQARELIADNPQALFLLSSTNTSGQGLLYSNVTSSDKAPYTSLEDISPTLLALAGCQSNPAQHSTGQNVFSPQRNWLVTTQDDKIVLFSDKQRIDVDRQGNYSLYDVKTGQAITDDLNTSLLSQAVKHLSRFIEN